MPFSPIPQLLRASQKPAAESLRSTARLAKPLFPQRLLRTFILVLLTAPAVSCAASAAEVKRARTSGYNADFSTVYGETLLAVTKLYPRNEENAVDGIIRTAWHPVATEGGARNSQTRSSSVAGANQNPNLLSGSADADSKQFFIRFRVHVVGGKPWRVRVEAEASEIAAGAHPKPLLPNEEPSWLKGRSNALRVAIYKRLKGYAVRVEEEIPQAEGAVVVIDEPPSFGEIPSGSQEMLSEIYRSISLRSFGDLRAQLADDVQWSKGDAGSAEVAMIMWQADTSLLEAMREVITSGCIASAGGGAVSCPASPKADSSGHRLTAEKRGKRWFVTAFVELE